MTAPSRATERQLAIEGGRPVRTTMLPYGRQQIGEEDVEAVLRVLRGGLLTTGPEVEAFEGEMAAFCGARRAVALANGTAALHGALHAIGVGPGDEVVVPAITFLATANAALYLGATPRFADVDPRTLLLDPDRLGPLVNERTRAVVTVDYAGQPADPAPLRAQLEGRDIALVADACHSLGGFRDGLPVGTLADLSCFSFHPVKAMTTGEGGMVVTGSDELADRVARFRNHGIDRDSARREREVSWEYDMVELGYNYRLTDLQCALGRSQLRRLEGWIERRGEIARRYDERFADLPGARPLAVEPGVRHARHLYVLLLEGSLGEGLRRRVFEALRAEGIGVNVHYRPVYLNSWYRRRLGTAEGLCPVAEDAYRRMITLPLYAGMSDEEADQVVRAVEKVLSRLLPDGKGVPPEDLPERRGR
jgi:perosamine synthetase